MKMAFYFPVCVCMCQEYSRVQNEMFISENVLIKS